MLYLGWVFGDLSAFLRARGFQGRYTGIDFVPELIEAGRNLYPDEDLQVADVAQLAGEATFDLVVESGIFNSVLRHEDNRDHIAATLAKMFSLCNVAVTADFMTSHVDFVEPDVYYASPDEVLEMARSLTRRTLLRQDYLPFEVAV